MEYLIKFNDIDPDTGDVSQTMVVAAAHNENYAKVITEFLNKDDGYPNRDYSYQLYADRFKEIGDTYHDRLVMSSAFVENQICGCCGDKVNTTTCIEHDSQNYDLDLHVCSDCYIKTALYWKEYKPKKIAPI